MLQHTGNEGRRGYKPNRGGHAPGTLRDAFTDLVEDDAITRLDQSVEVGGIEKSVRWLLGRLWNCTDCLPGTYCDDLDIPSGSSYAKASRKLMATLEA